MPQTLSDIKRMLAGRGLRPKHRLGQNFLHDHNHMARIIDAAQIAVGERVLEVGAGTGSLSEALLEAGAWLVAVEIDGDLGSILEERLEPFGDRARLYIGDILTNKHTVNPEPLALLESLGDGSSMGAPGTVASEGGDASAFKLVANLPYHIASPLLIDLAMDHPAMRLGVVMVQREVADRLVAFPGSKVYGPLSVLVQAMYEVRRVATLPASCFWPPPKVSSAVVRLERRVVPATDAPYRLAALVQKLFQQRRKQLGTLLGRDAPLPEGVSARDRPERLSVSQLAELAGRLGGGH